mmetsp:Transcript_2623/g.3043  ORF Transcript_2623/g.3043 Transcript_2623/m.3043 type:complete len:338 (-) Transcript_2623:1001-2014(-)
MAVCGTKESDSNWLNTECCGLVCACVTYALLLFAEYAMVFVILDPWFVDGSNSGYIHSSIFSVIVVLAIVSHLKAMTTDPGAVPRDAMPINLSEVQKTGVKGKKNFRMCLKCDSFKPGRTHHCSICRRCVVKMDHHCPWVNNCVGLGNHKFFLLFLLYVFTSSIYALTMIFTRFVQCSSPGPRLRGHRHHNVTEKPGCDASIGGSMIMFGVVLEALLFGLFTLCMMCDQWSVVLSSVTQIDRLKGERARKRSLCENLTEVFGGEPRFSITWLLPTPVRFKDREQTFGYRRRVHDDSPHEIELVVAGDEKGSNGSKVGENGSRTTTTQQGKKYSLINS